jgi:hypothetical protein
MANNSVNENLKSKIKNVNENGSFLEKYPNPKTMDSSSKSSNNEDLWNTSDKDLIYDFLDQVEIIDELEKTRNSLKPANCDKKEAVTFKNDKKGKKKLKFDPKILNFEQDNFDENFYFHLSPENLNFYEKDDPKHYNFWTPRNAEDMTKLKKKWKHKMITLTKSLHFFKDKKKLIPCKYCKKMFSANGMGGHVSRNHKNLSINYNRREQTKRYRRVTKERNRKFVQLEEKKEKEKEEEV